jgi:hypothetical protein
MLEAERTTNNVQRKSPTVIPDERTRDPESRDLRAILEVGAWCVTVGPKIERRKRRPEDKAKENKTENKPGETRTTNNEQRPRLLKTSI